MGLFDWINGMKPQENKNGGEFKDSKKNIQKTYPNGDKYVGEYKDDKRNGKGTYTLAKGRIIKGQWRNDKYVGKKE